MTREDFSTIAATIRSEHEDWDYEPSNETEAAQKQGADEALSNLALSLCHVFLKNNPYFSFSKFFAACGLPYAGTD